MNNSKEVVILIIMIFVVLVSAAKADDGLVLRTEDVFTEAGLEYFELDNETVFSVPLGEKNVADSSLELGVASTSSKSNLEDDYGLILTITTMF